jgi:glutamate racemase
MSGTGTTGLPGFAPFDCCIGAIGIFDSGWGGLSVMREVQRLLPAESIHYIGDNCHVPYGTRPIEEIQQFSLTITRFLLEQLHCRCIVVACNTATSAAVPLLRETFPFVPIVAMEPGVKPAVQETRTGKVAVLATPGTLASSRLAHLMERFAGGVEVITQPCPGWVECVESGALDTPYAHAVVAAVVEPLMERGVDTLVLGCTHYPFLVPLIRRFVPPETVLIDTGPAVARRVATVLPETKGPLTPSTACCYLWTTGVEKSVRQAARNCLQEGFARIDGVHTLYWTQQGELTTDSRVHSEGS